MSYSSQAQLTNDSDFNGRSNAVATQQAAVYKDDQRPNWKSTAQAVLRGNVDVLSAFVRMNAAGPGVADKVEQPNGDIDQSLVTDGDLLSLTQANWPTISDVFFTADGTPIGG